MLILQIYFKPEQLAECEHHQDNWYPIYNPECTIFMENEVIRDAINREVHLQTDYFGVVSYKLKKKLGYMKENWKNNKHIANTSVTEYTPWGFERELYKHKPDAMSFQRHAPHDTIAIADGFHPGFAKHFETIMKKIGFPYVKKSYEDVFYCNYVVMKAELYDKYVKEMLIPAMDVMKDMPELWDNSHYPQAWPEELKQRFGINHWSFHPFICERFITVWADYHRLRCLHY